MMCEGKAAIVTGAAGRGMGRSIALTLAREGADVIVNYLTSEDEAKEIVDYIRGQGGRALAFQADICNQDRCRDMYNKAVEEFGKVDICIVGPGAGWHPEAIDKLDTAAALEDVNKETAPLYNMMPLVLPGMYEREWGRFIGISVNLSANSPSFAYDAAKAARTHILHRASGEAWKHGVTVNIIAPGPVKEAGNLEGAIALCEHGPEWETRKNITPQDIAEGVAVLCSESGRFITGCELTYKYY
jgi:NAD(P)-dependent dehydrogenase (short-subunit alcohol dehydrogenase family)